MESASWLFFYPPKHPDRYIVHLQVGSLKCRGDPHSHQAGPPGQLFSQSFFLDPYFLHYSAPGRTTRPAQWAGSVRPLSNSNFISAWKKEKKGSLFILSTQQNVPLFYAKALEIPSALVQQWHTHTGPKASANAFSLLSAENVSPLQSPRPGLS